MTTMATTTMARYLRRPLLQDALITREIKSLRGKSNASARWVRRQWNDPHVKLAKREGLRSRAAFKLRELNDKFQLITKGDVVLDLGAAPGGWSQIAVAAAKSTSSKVTVVAVDLLRIDPIEGVAMVIGDFRQAQVRQQIEDHLGQRKKADVIVSDMAPSFSGNAFADSQNQLRLCYNAMTMADLYLKTGGNFATKVLRGEDAEVFRSELKQRFAVVKGMKPTSSRPESTEIFLVAKGYKPKEETTTPTDD